MADWMQKISKNVGTDLAADEKLEGGMLVNPAGMLGAMMGKELGGLAGAAIAAKLKSDEGVATAAAGLASTLPKEPLVLGLSHRRMFVWGHSKLTGKPKGLIRTFDLDEVAGIALTPQKATVGVAVDFADGSAITFEAPKLMNDPDRFAGTFGRLKG